MGFHKLSSGDISLTFHENRMAVVSHEVVLPLFPDGSTTEHDRQNPSCTPDCSATRDNCKNIAAEEKGCEKPETTSISVFS